MVGLKQGDGILKELKEEGEPHNGSTLKYVDSGFLVMNKLWAYNLVG